MNIKKLKANKKNRNLVLYLRKVVESYRAGFVSSKELKTDLHMDFKRVRQLNRWYFKHRIIPYLKPKKRKQMKPEINKVKDLEAKIKWLEKDNEMLRMKSIAWETLVDIAEKQFDIPIRKKFAPKLLKR